MHPDLLFDPLKILHTYGWFSTAGGATTTTTEESPASTTTHACTAGKGEDGQSYREAEKHARGNTHIFFYLECCMKEKNNQKSDFRVQKKKKKSDAAFLYLNVRCFQNQVCVNHIRTRTTTAITVSS